MAVTVTMFNSSAQSLQVQINNGASFPIPGSSPPGWAPQSPASGGPTWGSMPTPNGLGPGNNMMTVTPSGSVEPFSVQMSLAPHVNWTSVQIFLFLGSGMSLSWIVQNNGQYVTGQLAAAQTS